MSEKEKNKNRIDKTKNIYIYIYKKNKTYVPCKRRLIAPLKKVECPKKKSEIENTDTGKFIVTLATQKDVDRCFKVANFTRRITDRKENGNNLFFILRSSLFFCE